MTQSSMRWWNLGDSLFDPSTLERPKNRSGALFAFAKRRVCASTRFSFLCTVDGVVQALLLGFC